MEPSGCSQRSYISLLQSEVYVTPLPCFVASHCRSLFDPSLRFLPAQSRSCCREERPECSSAELSITTAFKETGKHNTLLTFLRCPSVCNVHVRRYKYIRCGHIWKSFVFEKLGISTQSRETPPIVSCAKNCKDMVITLHLW